jgi:hypothetical protein
MQKTAKARRTEQKRSAGGSRPGAIFFVSLCVLISPDRWPHPGEAILSNKFYKNSWRQAATFPTIFRVSSATLRLNDGGYLLLAFSLTSLS